MTREETTMIVDRIQTHRQYFLVTDKVYREWGKILEPYDYIDVDKELTEFLQNGENYGKAPEAYQLVKRLLKTSEKSLNNDIIVFCKICNKEISLEKYDEHFNKCSSIQYVIDNHEKYYDKKISREKLMELDDKTFDSMYWKFSKQLLEKLTTGKEKDSLIRTLEIHKLLEEQNDRIN